MIIKTFAKSFLQICLGISLVLASFSFLIMATKPARANPPAMGRSENGRYVFFQNTSKSDGKLYWTVLDTRTGNYSHDIRTGRGFEVWRYKVETIQVGESLQN